MPKKKPDDDNHLFKKATQGVKPLKVDKVIVRRKKKPSVNKTKPFQASSSELDADYFYFSDYAEQEDVGANQALHFVRPGVQQRRFRRFKQGKISPERVLDLHGLKREEAAQSVALFLEEAVLAHVSCVLIIHGKGGRMPDAKPILKTKLNAWLTQYPAVMAFCSALPKDGGTGALYVLLKHLP